MRARLGHLRSGCLILGPSPQSLADWQLLEGIGRVGSVMIAVSSRNPITLHDTDVIYEPGGAL